MVINSYAVHILTYSNPFERHKLDDTSESVHRNQVIMYA